MEHKDIGRNGDAICWLVRFAAGCIMVLSAIGCTRPLDETERAGKQIYDNNCSACHDEDQYELKTVPPKLNGIFPSGTLPDGTTTATDSALREIILYGKRTMPAFDGRLNDEQVVELLAYLHRK